MNHASTSRHRMASCVGTGSFTLIEMMASMAIIFILMAIIAAALQGMSKLWLTQRNHVQTFQSGRSALDLMVRDLTSLENPRSSFIDGTGPTSVTQRCNLQFIQDAGDPLYPKQPLNSLLSGSTYEQVPYSSSVFGQARLDNTPQGNLWIIGYYLARSTDRTRYQLRKFLVSPASPTGTANPNYLLYPASATYSANATNSYSSGQPYWIYFGTPTSTTPKPTAFQTNSYVVSENVVALWVRCLDNLGQPIPWLSATTTNPSQPNTAPVKFNSASPFVMAPVIGATNASTATNFIYQPCNNVLLANRLPAALEVTSISIDTQAVKQLVAVDLPLANVVSQPSDIPIAATNYLQQLYNRHVPSARLFQTTVRMPEAN